MAERRSNPFGWFILGLLVGVALTVAAYLVLNQPAQDGAAEETPLAGSVAPPPPVAITPAPGMPTAPVAAAPKPAGAPLTPAPPPSVDQQIAEDAAATGMTGSVNPPADQPVN